MSDEPRDGLDRRDFIRTTIASVGATAIIAASTGAASAQGKTPPADGPTHTASQTTVYTGDVIHGKEGDQRAKRRRPGARQARFVFPGCANAYGSLLVLFLSIVAKGTKPGRAHNPH